MSLERFIKKINRDKKIATLSEKMKEAEKNKNLANGEMYFHERPNANIKNLEELELELEYHEHIKPTLEEIEKRKQERIKTIEKAKAEYHKKTKAPLEELEKLGVAERKLFGGGGWSNYWITEKNHSALGLSKEKTLDEIGQSIISHISREVEREKKRLAKVEARKKEEEKQKKEELSK